MRTRFEWGLIADISVPDYETRMAILYKKIELDQLERYQIPDEVIQYIAMNIKTNIRELEGSLNKLIALYRIGGRKNFDVSLAAEALKDMIAPDDSHKVTPELVLDVVSDHFNVSVSAFVDVPRGCCVTVALKNISAQAIDVANANLIVTRQA